MKKRIVLFAILVCLSCIVLGALSFLSFFGFSLFHLAFPVTIRALQASPQSWVGKRVCVHGQISYGVFSVPEAVPPYNCLLEDPESKAFIGVDWRKTESTYFLDGKNVTVVGVMTKGYSGPLWVEPEYYIKAENIALSLQFTFEI